MTAQIEKPTEKQLKYIESIEDNTGIIFTGKTKEDASNYISANKSHPTNGDEWAITNGY